MDLAEKLRELRLRAGARRGLERPLTQAELAQAIHATTGSPISQGYVSQLENGKRTHLTEKTRNQLAAFFEVHPGYLVSDPAGAAHAHLAPHGADHPAAHHALARLAVHPQRHTLWALIDLLIDLPPDDLVDLHNHVRARHRAHQ
jgi:transcriptional regulator with XRE-family HTH domain